MQPGIAVTDYTSVRPYQQLFPSLLELHPFNDRRLTRDLVELCQREEAAQPRLPDGRLLVLCITGICRLSFAVQQERVA